MTETEELKWIKKQFESHTGLSNEEIETRIRKFTEKFLNRTPRRKVAELPDELYNKIVGQGQITEEGSVTNIGQNYEHGVLPNIGLPWQDNQANQPTNLSITLPIRLVNVSERKVETIMPSPAITDRVKNYAILSHYWGDRGAISAPAANNEWHRLYTQYRGIIGGANDDQHPKAYKSLLKAARALEFIDSRASSSTVNREYFLRDFRAVGGNAASITRINDTRVRNYRKSSDNGSWHLTGTQAGNAYNNGWTDHSRIRVNNDGRIQGQDASGSWLNIPTINYLWMDQLCIDQKHTRQNQPEQDVRGHNVEQDRELLKMRRYYANSTLTLVSINTRLEQSLRSQFRSEYDRLSGDIKTSLTSSKITSAGEYASWKWSGRNNENTLVNNVDDIQGNFSKWLSRHSDPNQSVDGSNSFSNALDILSIIMRSEWRFSPWTYKEGWLSKQTIFMFDDYLIDGRFLAMIWAKRVTIPSMTSPRNLGGGFKNFRKEYRGKYATPIGWAYEEVKQSGENLITIRLNVALTALIGRKKSSPLDSIRSILPVLPYGHLVEIEKWREWENPPSPPENETPGQRRIRENRLFQRALCDVMKVGAMNGYGNFLTWFGLSSATENSWLPEILPISSAIIDDDDDGGGGGIFAHRVITNRGGTAAGSDTFLTNMVPRHRGVYCAPGVINLSGSETNNYLNNLGTAIEFNERITRDSVTAALSERVILKGFREYDITNIGSGARITSEQGPNRYFYRLDPNNAVSGEIFSKRTGVIIEGHTITLEGTRETLGTGTSATDRGEIGKYNKTAPPFTSDEKDRNTLKLLVPNNDIWRSVRIDDSNGTEGNQIPIALLVERQGANQYRRIDLVRLSEALPVPLLTTLDLNQGQLTSLNSLKTSQQNEITAAQLTNHQLNQTQLGGLNAQQRNYLNSLQYTAQIEVWPNT